VWDRKPRGPKAKAPEEGRKASGAAAGTARAKRATPAVKGAPRSERSAGSAYLAAKGAATSLNGDGDASNGSISAGFPGAPGSVSSERSGASGTAQEEQAAYAQHALFSNGNFLRRQSLHPDRPYPPSPGGSSGYSAHYPASHRPPAYEYPPGPGPQDYYRGHASSLERLPWNQIPASPATGSTGSASSYAPVEYADLRTRPQDAEYADPVAPRRAMPASHEDPRAARLDVFGRSWAANSPYPQVYAPPGSSRSERSQAQGSGGRRQSRERQSSQGSVYDRPPMLSAERRGSVVLSLIDQLSGVFIYNDRQFIALALAQFSDLDASTKLFPARILWGSVPDADGALPPPPPQHAQLALLSLLAHRALLLPSVRSQRDLESLQQGMGEDLSHLNQQPHDQELKDGLLLFARRCWNLAHDTLLRLVADGEVDPLLLITGYALDMAASEDGIGTASMGEMKAWLFGVLKAWNLHLMDLPAHVSPEEAVDDDGAAPYDAELPPGTPMPRPLDARYAVLHPADREALRRCVVVVCTSFVWTQSNDNFAKHTFNLSSLKVSLLGADNTIHRGAAWAPPAAPPNGATPSDTSICAVQHVAFLLFGRILRMLNTPLEDLLNGTGAEPDLQKAVDEIEETLQWAKACIPVPKLDGTEMPLAVSAFLHLRVIDLMSYRLFAAIVLYQNFTNEAVDEGGGGAAGSLRLKVIMEPGPNLSTQYETLRSGAAGISPVEGDGMPPAPPRKRRELLRVSKDPSTAAMAPLFEVDAVVRKTLELLENHEEPVPGEVGTAAGVTLGNISRAMRWPRHLHKLCSQAFAIGAEVEASQKAWREHFVQHRPEPYWAEPVTHNKVPPLSESFPFRPVSCTARRLPTQRAAAEVAASASYATSHRLNVGHWRPPHPPAPGARSE
jgi:hypothetical protein